MTQLDIAIYTARMVATQSNCLDKHVGCVLLDTEWHIIGTGCNLAEECRNETKCPKLASGPCPTLHAELDALHNCHGIPHICVCTLEPCHECATVLQQAGCELVCFEDYTNPEKSGKNDFKGKWSRVIPGEYSFDNLLEKIRKYHEKLGYPKVEQASLGGILTATTRSQARDLCLATVDEVMEILHSFDWKPWKNYNGVPVLNKQNFLEEVGDVIFFLDSLLMNFDLSWEDCKWQIYDKIETNYQRISTGYHN